MAAEGRGIQTRSSLRYAVFFGIVLFVMALLILVPTKTIYEEFAVSYNETVTYTENVPYTERVTVYPTASFWQGISSGIMQGEGCPYYCDCDTYHYSGYTKICTYCICPATTPTPEPEFRTVTKYREVQKTRQEQRTRMEQRPVEVNWIFGYKTPYSFPLPLYTFPLYENSSSGGSCPYVPCEGAGCDTRSDAGSFPYILRGTPQSLRFGLEKELAAYTHCRSAELGGRHQTTWIRINNVTVFQSGGLTEFYAKFLDDPRQKPAIVQLSGIIRETVPGPDDQARIAVSLVQSIPYQKADLSGPIKLPYDVLYTGSGDCDEKSLLLAALLRELGYNVSLLRFDDQKHMAVGIRVPTGFDYNHTGYAFIETTNPAIISFNSVQDMFGVQGNPVIIPVSDGREFSTIPEEYTDAANLEKLTTSSRKNGTLSQAEVGQILTLKNKYGLNISVSYV
jgi:hypothetical protein